jgi:hypothetical protein
MKKRSKQGISCPNRLANLNPGNSGPPDLTTIGPHRTIAIQRE